MAAAPVWLRARSLDALATLTFSFTLHERAVLKAAANTIAPGATVSTRNGTMTVPSAGDAGAAAYIETLLGGAFLFAGGVRRPPYVPLPAGVTAPLFPHAGADALWAVKRMGWFGDAARLARPWAWPSELQRLQTLYRNGVSALDAAVAPLTFDAAAAAPLREPVLRQLHASEAAAYDGQGEGKQPFFLTLLDHVAEACFGDPVYGGNHDWVYWRMVNFSGPSFINGGGPAPGQGWTWQQLAGPFRSA
ncbi:MAG: gluconate 2-dehydrogenase subunit 3 family protein [Chloroflexi bacterium]|nr:MAG: gluconate 2-dehydrogenase subunit 3 family protein [Chloroflexota bacterium]